MELITSGGPVLSQTAEPVPQGEDVGDLPEPSFAVETKFLLWLCAFLLMVALTRC